MFTIFRLYRYGDIIRVIILSEIFMAFLNYNKDEKLEFNYKRACGLWLIVIAAIILNSYFNRRKTNNKYASI